MRRPLTDRQVKRMFREERAAFAEHFPQVAQVGLVITPKHYERDAIPRDVAWFDQTDGQIYLIRKALWRELDCLRGVIRHEFGHVADEHINEPGCERRADRIAYLVTGEPILYTTEGIQHTSRGVAYRPDWLHQ